MNSKLTALIPMREGSQRVPNKNIRAFAGEPLFSKVLSTLQQCTSIGKIVIDTDSSYIKDFVLTHFSQVMIIDRPKALSGGEVAMNQVIAYDLAQIPGNYFLQTHATNPLLTVNSVIQATEIFFEQLNHGYDSLFSVNIIKTRLYDSVKKPINHDPRVLLPTQDLSPVYEENSNLYLFSRQSFEKNQLRIGEHPFFYEMSKLESWDIDNADDFRIAEMIYQASQKQSGRGV